jgi:TPR repeat protein
MDRMKAITSLALVAAATWLPAPFVHADLAEGLRWMQRGQMQRAYDELKESAEKGDVLAARVLGILLMRTTVVAGGKTFEARPQEAAKWLRVAADGGDRKAQRYTAAFHAGGFGVPRDPEEALRWAEKSGARTEATREQAVALATGDEAATLEIHAWLASLSGMAGQELLYPRAAINRNQWGKLVVEIDAATRAVRIDENDAGDALGIAADKAFTAALEVVAPPESLVRRKMKVRIPVEFALQH